MRLQCPLCHLEDKIETELFYLDPKVIIVRDRDPKGYAFRVLAVWREHIPYSALTEEQRQYLLGKLGHVMETLSSEGRAERWTYDTELFRIPQHAHVQACVSDGKVKVRDP